MLYRPMTKDGSDLLFSGSVTVATGPERPGGRVQLSADVEHLTCFIGGMVGLGAKVFGIEGDLEIAKKLAEGCVWAYESFPLGIMPETAIMMPCANSDNCPWNETAYREFIDPVGAASRQEQIDDYFERKAIRAKEAEATRKAALEAAAALELYGSDDETTYDTTDGVPPTGLPAITAPKGSDSLKKEEPISLQKRQLDLPAQPPTPNLGNLNIKDKAIRLQAAPKEEVWLDVNGEPVVLTPMQKAQKQKELDTAAELAAFQTTAGHGGGKGSVVPPMPLEPLSEDPFKPLTHDEYVDKIIRDQLLPPGFVTVGQKKYILR